MDCFKGPMINEIIIAEWGKVERRKGRTESRRASKVYEKGINNTLIARPKRNLNLVNSFISQKWPD